MGTQVLPSDDDFAYGGDHYGSNVLLYIGCKVTTSTTPAQWHTRVLHSGYQTYGGDGINDTPAALVGATGEAGASRFRPGGMLWRANASLADVTVKSGFRLYTSATPATYTHLSLDGVMCRVQGGSLQADGTPVVRYDDPSCYIAYYWRDGTSVSFVLARVNTGTFLTLTSTTRAGNLFEYPDLEQVMTVSLDAENTATSVGLTANFSGAGMTTPIALSYSDVITGASVLTGVGRCGFSMGRDRIESEVRAADLCTFFTILSGSDVLVHDQFERYQVGAGYDFSADAVYGDLWDNEGYSLQMAYTWDSFSGGDEIQRMKRDADSQRMKWSMVTSESASTAACISSRPATNSRSQHRSVQFEVDAQPDQNQTGVGIVLRASQPTPVTGNFEGGTGYLAMCHFLSGSITTPTWIIWRYITYQGKTYTWQLAQHEDAGSVFWGGYGNTWTMDFEVYTQSGSTLDGQPTEFKIKTDIGGGLQQVTLSCTEFQNESYGCYADAAGTVTDTSGIRIRKGQGEGLVFYNLGLDATSVAVWVDDWTEETLTNQGLPDRDQASIVVVGEGSTTGAELSSIIGVDYPLQVRTQQFSIKHRFSSGHTTANPRFTNSTGAGITRTVYTCSVNGVKDATLSTFLDYWQDHNGSELALPFKAPDASTSMACHFVADSLQHRLISINAHALSFQLEEVK